MPHLHRPVRVVRLRAQLPLCEAHRGVSTVPVRGSLLPFRPRSLAPRQLLRSLRVSLQALALPLAPSSAPLIAALARAPACRSPLPRTRDCEELDVLMHCVSQPSIETSRNVRFGCYQYFYFALAAQFERAHLSVFNNRWSEVRRRTLRPPLHTWRVWLAGAASLAHVPRTPAERTRARTEQLRFVERGAPLASPSPRCRGRRAAARLRWLCVLCASRCAAVAPRTRFRGPSQVYNFNPSYGSATFLEGDAALPTAFLKPLHEVSNVFSPDESDGWRAQSTVPKTLGPAAASAGSCVLVCAPSLGTAGALDLASQLAAVGLPLARALEFETDAAGWRQKLEGALERVPGGGGLGPIPAKARVVVLQVAGEGSPATAAQVVDAFNSARGHTLACAAPDAGASAEMAATLFAQEDAGHALS